MINPNLSKFNNYCSLQLKKLSNVKYHDAFAQFNWQEYAQEICKALVDPFDVITEKAKQSATENSSLILLFSWDHQGNDSGICIDYDFTREDHNAFEDGANDPRPIVDFADFIKEKLGESSSDLRNVDVDDYRLIVDILSKMLIEVALQNTQTEVFKALTKTVNVDLVFNYFHGDEATYFYQSKAPVSSLFDDAGIEQPIYRSEKDTLAFVFEQDNIELFSRVLPTALASADLSDLVRECFLYTLARTRDESLGNENVWSILKLVAPFAIQMQRNKGYYDALVCNVIKIHKDNAEFISYLDENFFPEDSAEPNVTYDFARAYASVGNKDEMLVCMEFGLRLGKPKHAFMKDEDFKAFRDDPDFLNVLNNTPIDSDLVNKDLHVMVKRGDFDDVKERIALGADINGRDQFGKSVVEVCIGSFSNDKHLFFNYLLEKGVELNFENLKDAFWWGDLSISTHLLERFPLNSLSQYELWKLIESTCYSSSVEALNLLVEHGFDVTITDDHNNTILHQRDAHKKIDFMARLVELGADFKQLNDVGKTPIFASDNQESIKKLVEWGVDINQLNTCGQSVLHNEIGRDDIESFEFLVNLGADVHVIDNNGESLLHHCTSWDGAKNCLNKLIALNVDINTQDAEGRTALHNAAKYRLVGIMKDLIAAGADKTIRNNDNELAIDLADIEQTKALLV